VDDGRDPGSDLGRLADTQTNSASSSATPFGFQGGYTDPSGLVYLIHSYYDPTTAQSLSVDPDLAQTGQPYACRTMTLSTPQTR